MRYLFYTMCTSYTRLFLVFALSTPFGWNGPNIAARQQITEARRAQSIFGMVTAPLKPIDIPVRIRSILPKGSVVYVLVHTRMAPGGEDVVVYYHTPANDDGSPEIAIVRDGGLEENFSYSDDPYWHDVIVAYAVFALESKRDAFALCVTNSGDGHYSDFVILTWTPSGYKSILQDFGNAQAQIRIREKKKKTVLELWSPGGYPPGAKENEQCIWCPQFYDVNTYEWRKDKLVKTNRHWRTKEPLVPGTVASKPFSMISDRVQ